MFVPVTLGRPGSDESLQTQGLIDTGSTVSCISAALVERLHLEPIGKEAVLTLSGPVEGLTYFLDAGFPVNLPGLGWHGIYTIERIACLAFAAERPYEFLIGWDLLGSAQVTINGPGRIASICF
ncbi:aspartyl protease family protein [Endothiovibrio diazotrophicus]